MAFDMSLFGERLKEAFNGETQAKVGERMFTEQGTISKYVTGKQLPPLDKVYQIASLYGVSVDWLLGLSDTKERNDDEKSMASYAYVISALSDLLAVNGAEIVDGDELKDHRSTDKELVLRILDPLTNALLTKSLTLFRTDPDLYRTWRTDKLTAFDDRELIEEMVWQDNVLSLQTRNEMSETAWLKLHDRAREIRKEFLWLYEEVKTDEK